MAVEYILKNSLLRRTLDNVTVVLIAFSNFKHAAFGQGSSSGRNKLKDSSQMLSDSSRVDSKIMERKKENIPPEQIGLQINTNGGGSMQSLKTTTNAQLVKDAKKMGLNTCNAQGKSKHFDFYNV